MYIHIWKNKNTRYYLAAGSVSRLGDGLSGMAFLFLAYDLTGSSSLTTGMAVAATLPYLLFGLVGGVIADWVPRKKLLIFLDSARVPLILSVVGLYYMDWLTYGYLLGVSFIIQSVGCFFNPAHRSVLPSITSPKERPFVNSLYDTLTRGVSVLSPLLSLWLLNSHGAIQFFTLDAFTYTLSALCLRQVDINENNTVTDHSIKAALRSVKEFVIWLSTQSTIKQLFFFTFLTVFFNTWVWEVGLLLALTEITSSGEEWYSVLQGVFGGVVIVTNLLLPYIFKKMSLHIYLTGGLIWGAGITYYGIFYDLGHFIIGCAITAVGLPIAGLTRVYLIQALVPGHKMGRAFSFNAVLLYLSNTISLAVYGFLALIIPIQTLMIVSGFTIITISTGGLLCITVNFSKLSRRFPIHFFK
ncbi:MFS transporter [Halobacillus andaensis]|uniref:MFS transporter n=1 Tax=Halobacillus andaensis TaxID=1176239 RepID=UPI003D72037E